jgi:hypothetical protein
MSTDEPPTDADDTSAANGSVPGADRRWVLARQTVAVPQLGLSTSVTPIRVISEDEQAAIDAAEGAFERFGAEWVHNRALRRMQDYVDAARTLSEAAERAIGVINEADVERLKWALLNYAQHMASWVDDAGSDEGAAIAGPSRRATGNPAVGICRAIASTPDSSVEIVVSRRPGAPLQIVTRGLESDPKASHDASAVVAASLVACQQIADVELLSAEAGLLEAGLILRRLAAEVVWGQPVLIPEGTVLVGGSDPQVTVRKVAVLAIDPVMVACAVARVRFATANRPPTNNAPSGSRPASAAATTPSGSSRRADPSVVSADGKAEASTGQQGLPVGGDQEDGPIAGDAAAGVPTGPNRPVDLRLVLMEATSFATETEQHWSDALKKVMAGDVGDVSARSTSLLMALYGEIAERQKAGTIPATLSFSLPLDAATAAQITLDSKDDARAGQYAAAVIYALGELASAVTGLQKPTASRIDLRDGGMTSWWRQAGFSRVHEAAEFAARLVGAPGTTGPARALEMFGLAGAAWRAGLPEAAVVYELAALGGGAESDADLADARRVLTTAAERVVSGQDVPLDAVVLIARFWLEELARRLPGQPPFAHPPGAADAG